MQMFPRLGLGIDLQRYMRQFASWEIAQKANNWTGQNIVRWSNAEYDRLWQQAKTELDAESAPPSSSA